MPVFLEIRHNFLNGLELEQIDKRVRHQHEKPRVGIVQICTDDLVDFIQSLIERVAVDKKMLGCRRGDRSSVSLGV